MNNNLMETTCRISRSGYYTNNAVFKEPVVSYFISYMP